MTENYSASDLKLLRALALLCTRDGGIDAAVFEQEISALGAVGMTELAAETRKDATGSRVKALLEDKVAVKSALDEVAAWQEEGIRIVCAVEGEYPEMLKRIFKPPALLFYKGVLKAPMQGDYLLSIVGSRRADSSGCQIAEALAYEAAASGYGIVSGLAYGIDAAAHRGALRSKNEFPTIAVLGNGLASVYPSNHCALAEEILAHGGLLLSQFEPPHKPFPSNFLDRNRIIAGLAKGTLVVQATERSGSLVTARYALEEGREVMVVPGAIDDPRYEGSNNLIKQGAYLVTAYEDIAALLPPRQKEDRKITAQSLESGGTGPLAKKIIGLLKENRSMSCDKIFECLPDENGLGAELTMLELAGVIRTLPGNQVALVR